MNLSSFLWWIDVHKYIFFALLLLRVRNHPEEMREFSAMCVLLYTAIEEGMRWVLYTQKQLKSLTSEYKLEWNGTWVVYLQTSIIGHLYFSTARFLLMLTNCYFFSLVALMTTSFFKRFLSIERLFNLITIFFWFVSKRKERFFGCKHFRRWSTF